MKYVTLSILLLLAFGSVSADVGFVATENNTVAVSRAGSAQWYAHGHWWMIIWDPTYDLYVFKKDQPTPTTPGTLGGWTRTDTLIDTKSSTRVEVVYNPAEDRVHLVRKRSSRNVPLYNELEWDPGTETYVKDMTLGDITGGLTDCSPFAECNILVDSNGRVVVLNEVERQLIVHHTTTDRATWSSYVADLDIESDNNPAGTVYVDPVTGPGIAVMYWKEQEWAVLRTLDDDAAHDPANWSAPETVTFDEYTTDNHNCLRADGGDLYVSFKDGRSDGMFFTQRVGGGSWIPPILLSTGGLRTEPTIGLIGSEVYVFWRQDDNITYRKSDRFLPSFGPPVVALNDDSNPPMNHPTTPKIPSSPGIGMLVFAESSNRTFYDLMGLQTVPSTWYRDADGDTFGDPADTVDDTSPPPGYVADAGDCNDNDAAVNPNATEVCDGQDNDCDGTSDGSDAADAATWYQDSDGDGFGDPSSPIVACNQPAGFVADATDCNDAFASVNPGASELCDGLDNDCNGAVDEGVTSDAPPWFRDADNDLFGDSLDVIVACGQPAGYVATPGDCFDGDSTIYPGAPQLCNGVNDDCDDAGWPQVPADEADADGDGYRICDNDCDDGSFPVNPDGVESCNAVDDDCDGLIDEDEFGEDSDGDGVFNLCDNCSTDANPTQDDTDSDLLGDACDNCPADFNPDQSDLDGDDTGNVCDDDDDGDGVLDGADNCPLDANAGQEDGDLDGIGDLCDTTLISFTVPAARCLNGVATSELNLPDVDAPLPTCVGTFTRFASLEFSDDAVETAEFHTRLPIDWTDEVDVNLGWFTSDTTGATDWRIESGCSAGGVTDMTLGPVLNPAQVVSTANQAAISSINQTAFAAVTTDGCEAGDLLFLRISRDNVDSSTAPASLVDVEVTLRRNQ